MHMQITTYTDAEAFLGNTRHALESNEAANSLMLGICGQLVRHPGRVKVAPCLKTVTDETGLILAALMTPPHKLIVHGHQGNLDGGTKLLIADLLGEGWRVPGVLGPSVAAKRMAEWWVAVTGRGYSLERQQRVYELREVMVPVPERGRLRPAMEADIELATRWRYEFHGEIFGEADIEEAGRAAGFRIREGDVYLWEDQRPVSMAMRTRPTGRGISISLVYTPPELRRRGYATACVGELSRTLLEAGWEFCALFADLSNATSNHLYQRIGYRPVCGYDEYVFLEEEGAT
jgi:predicted GNAT family acetyltransferase